MSTMWKTHLRWFLPLFAVLTVAGTCLAIRTYRRSHDVQVQLSVVVEGKQVLATLTFYNHTAHDFYVDKDMACLRLEDQGKKPAITNASIFYVAAAGKRLHWGIDYKRPSSTPEEEAANYIKLSPGGMLQTPPVDLGKDYPFLPGPHEYVVTYSAFHGGPNPKLIRLTSNKVTFSFVGDS